MRQRKQKEKEKWKILTLMLFVGLALLIPDTTYAIDLFGIPSFESFLGWIMTAIVSLFGLILTLAAGFFNFVVESLVIEMGTSVKGTASIYKSWEILRDLGNIIIIFGVLAIGIATILRISGYGIKDLFSKLIVVALLINFSFFFTQAIVDTTNYIATQFYNEMEINKDIGIAGHFMNSLRIQSFYNNAEHLNEPTKDSEINTKLTGWQIFLSGALSIIFILIASFSFLAASILLVIRYGMLIFLMILSPIAFVFMAIPKASGHARDWWEALFKYSFFAPIYLLFTFITLKIISDEKFITGGREGGDFNFSSGVGFLEGSEIVFVNFAIVSVFMIASIILASKMSFAGAQTTLGWGKKWAVGSSKYVGKTGLRWGVRRAGALAREVESGNAQTRKRLNPMRAVMAVARPVGGAVANVPGVRKGLQNTAAAYRTDVDEKAASFEKLKTDELIRRLGKTTLPIDKVAIMQAIKKRNDLNDLNVDQVQMGVAALENVGISSRAIKGLRADAFYDSNKTDDENLDEMSKRVGNLNAGDMPNLRDVLVTETDGDGSLKEDGEKRRKLMARAILRTTDGEKLGAMFRRGDDISKALFEVLDEETGRDPNSKISRSSEEIKAHFNKEAEKEQALLDEIEEKKKRGEKVDRHSSSSYVKAQYTAAAWIETTPAKRLLGMDMPDNKSTQPSQGAPHQPIPQAPFPIR